MAQKLLKTDRCSNGFTGLAAADAINDNFTELYASVGGGGSGTSIMISALDYATGDGVADDTAALNTWLTAGDNLYLPPGTYKISGTLASISARTGVKILAHPQAKIVPTAGFSQTTAYIYLQNITGLVIDGLYIEGNGAIASPALDDYDVNMEGIFCEDCTDVIIQNCVLTNQPKAGIYTHDCSHVRILNNRVPNAYNFAIWTEGGDYHTIKDNWVSGNGTAQHDGTTLGQTPGIMVTIADYILIDGNTILDFKNTATKTEGCNHVVYSNNKVRTFGKDGIKVQAHGLGGITSVIDAKIIGNTVEHMQPWASDGAAHIIVITCEDFVVANNIIKGGERGDADGGQECGIYIQGTPGGFRCKRGIITDNVINTVGRSGIYGEYSDDIVVDNNYIYDYGVDEVAIHGIYFTSTPERLKISNNKVLNPDRPSTDFGHGIFIEGDGVEINITNNEIRFPREIGIYAYIGASDFVNISGNVIKLDSGSPAIGVRGAAGTLKSIKIDNNVMSGGIGTCGVWINRVGATTACSMVGNEMNNTSSVPILLTSSTVGKFTEAGNSISGSTTLPSFSSAPTLIQHGVYQFRGAGDPEGVVTAGVGAIYTRTDGGASTTLYVKTSGTGNTGWTAK